MANDGFSFSFGQWMLLALPLSLLLLVAIWLLITQVFFRSPPDLQLSSEAIDSERRKLGALTREQGVIFGVFVATALLWVFRNDLTLELAHHLIGQMDESPRSKRLA